MQSLVGDACRLLPRIPFPFVTHNELNPKVRFMLCKHHEMSRADTVFPPISAGGNLICAVPPCFGLLPHVAPLCNAQRHQEDNLQLSKVRSAYTNKT